MAYNHIETSVENGVCLVTLNRPEIRNALVVEMREELSDFFKSLQHDAGVKAVILTGEGKAFSAGGDLSTLQGINAAAGRKRLQVGHEVIHSIMDLEKPVIAAVNGAAAGAGTSLALACDMIIAARSSFFVQSFLNVGLIPDLGSIHFLPRLIGRHRAMELMLLGERVTAEQAYEIGLINRVVEDGLLLDEASSIALKLANAPGMAMGLTKRLVNRSMHADISETFEFEGFVQGLCFESNDFQEGVSAFMDKRKPQFNR
ncbi:Short-chain-enoyl-CoA hydratase [Peribacillus sp. Bi96]|uniref:enoyl-CoA hydratase/isomerase family protein n=1 Tax=unclassified Peribacillus TaxID=2675266 RepID=UPI001D7D3447|nr:enoyl-CoA hydratase [Peribacillus sp. Bi96]CAH0130718.1 Short-chain-enoyl-CoA hydratase [Peribacillus sp. Bi96]